MKILSLFSGGGGLDMAVKQLWRDAEIVAFSETDTAASQILARHWPDVPNLGDITAIDWTQVGPVDMIVGGFPCQDISHAGKRAGITEGTRSGLWFNFRDAVRTLRPRHVLLENVSAIATDGGGLDVVLGSLAKIGYDAEWGMLRASDVGAPHRRERWFCVARRVLNTRYGAGGSELGIEHAVPSCGVRQPGQVVAADRISHSADSDGGGHGGQQDSRRMGRLDGGNARTPRERERSWTEPVDRSAEDAPYADGEGLERRPRNGNPQRAGSTHGRHAPEGVAPFDAQRFGVRLPTPRASDGMKGSRTKAGAIKEIARGRNIDLGTIAATSRWGGYTPAIRRWESVLGRPAPLPTDDQGRLNAPFVEWMMGWPEGHTDGLSRAKALKILGNGVVPQQAVAAYTQLFARIPEPEAV